MGQAGRVGAQVWVVAALRRGSITEAAPHRLPERPHQSIVIVLGRPEVLHARRRERADKTAKAGRTKAERIEKRDELLTPAPGEIETFGVELGDQRRRRRAYRCRQRLEAPQIVFGDAVFPALIIAADPDVIRASGFVERLHALRGDRDHRESILLREARRLMHVLLKFHQDDVRHRGGGLRRMTAGRDRVRRQRPRMARRGQDPGSPRRTARGSGAHATAPPPSSRARWES